VLTAEEIVKRVGLMSSVRSNWERLWQDCSHYCLPRQNTFIRSNWMGGENRDKLIYDSTAPQALEKFAAAMESMLTPRTQRWHGLTLGKTPQARSVAVKKWLDSVVDILFEVRYSSRANFASQSSEVYMSLGSVGTGPFLVEDGLSKGIQYRAIHLSEIYISEDAWGRVDCIARKYKLTARQAVKRFGDRSPDRVKEVEQNNPEREFEFIHYVCENDKRLYGSNSVSGMKWSSYDVCVDTKDTVEMGGYRTQPYAVSRYVTGPRETYGRSPAMTVLADIKTLNEMSKTMLRYGQLTTDPPWLLPDSDALQAFAARSGALNFGGVDDQGNELVKALRLTGDPKLSLELMNQRRESINRAFLVTLFQVLVDAPQMTATEVMQRIQEKGALLAPAMGRQQSEFLGTVIDRELDILWAHGELPDPPEEVLAMGGAISANYDSPLTRLQKADEGVGILKTLENVMAFREIDPHVGLRIRADDAIQTLAEINGMPARLLASDEEYQQALEQARQQDQVAQMAQMAQPAAGAVKDLSAANKNMAPQQQRAA
jgi:hypothetical protein